MRKQDDFYPPDYFTPENGLDMILQRLKVKTVQEALPELPARKVKWWHEKCFNRSHRGRIKPQDHPL